MSLNKIKLTNTLITELYSKSLVDTKANKVDTVIRSQAQKESEWNYLGKNEKQIMVLVHYPDQNELTDKQFSFLNNMLAACKISLADIVLMNISQNPDANHKKLTEYFHSTTILLFGIEPASFGLPLSFPHFQVQTFANCTYLFTPTLVELENDKVLKSKLWVCLRRIFGI